MKPLFILLVSFTMLSSCATISPGLSSNATLEDITVEVIYKGQVDRWFLPEMDKWNIKIVNNSQEEIYIASSNVSLIVGDKIFRSLRHGYILRYPGESWYGDQKILRYPAHRGETYERSYRDQRILHSDPLPETILRHGYSIGGNLFFSTTSGSLLQKNRKAEFRVVLPIMPLKQSSYLVTLDITLP